MWYSYNVLVLVLYSSYLKKLLFSFTVSSHVSAHSALAGGARLGARARATRGAGGGRAAGGAHACAEARAVALCEQRLQQLALGAVVVAVLLDAAHVRVHAARRLRTPRTPYTTQHALYRVSTSITSPFAHKCAVHYEYSYVTEVVLCKIYSTSILVSIEQ